MAKRLRRQSLGRLHSRALDLLIATVAVHHDAELITFDADFEQIATVSTLRVTRLARPV